MLESGHIRPENSMSDFSLKLSKLVDTLNKDELEALLDERNAEKVKEFCKTLIAPKPVENAGSLPTEMTIGDRVYEILGFLKEDEKRIFGREMIKRVIEMKASLGKDDGQYLLDHQQDIPKSLRGKIIFVFTDRRQFDDSDTVFFVCWIDGRWVWSYYSPCHYDNRGVIDRVLRRKV